MLLNLAEHSGFVVEDVPVLLATFPIPYQPASDSAYHKEVLRVPPKFPIC